MVRAVLLVLVLVAGAAAGPAMKLYKKTNNKKFERVMVPVSSTVIPLDDLPVYQVGAGLGVATRPPLDERYRPDGPVKLITIHSLKNKNKKAKEGDSAHVEEVTQEEYRQMTQQQ